MARPMAIAESPPSDQLQHMFLNTLTNNKFDCIFIALLCNNIIIQNIVSINQTHVVK